MFRVWNDPKLCKCLFLVKEECVSEDEEEVKDSLVEEILQQGDTAIIYPEAPEDDQSPAETGGADENGNICMYKHVVIYLVSQSSSYWNQNIVFV